MNTAIALGDGRYRHRESMPFEPKPQARARTLDAAGVRRFIDREVDRALRPLKVQLRRAEREVDAIVAKNAATKTELAAVADKVAPLAAMRDRIRQGARAPSAAKVNEANRARWGRDAEGRVPGQPGFGIDVAAMRDAAAGAPSLAAAVNAMNRARWGRA